MKRLLSGSKDLSELVEKITWSGDTRQVARKLTFTIAQKASDIYLPKVDLETGADVLFLEGETVLFGGIIFDKEKSSSGETVSYSAFDLLFFLNNSQVSRIYDDTAENIAASVCSDLFVTLGSAAATGVRVYMPCFGKTGYEAIMMAYTEASHTTEKPYLPVIKNVNEVHVIEKGEWCGVVLEGTYNLEDTKYQESLEKMVNRVIITDKNGNAVSAVEDPDTLKFGIVQKVYKQEEGKEAAVEAKAMLQGMERSGSVTALSDDRAVSGYSIAIQDEISGLYGLFFIESDTHTYANGKEEMQLTLAFSNIMDEKEIERTEETKTKT
ncbi:hypothetical protein AALB39_18165 [Lachnospiraceae bacterium 54-53]